MAKRKLLSNEASEEDVQGLIDNPPTPDSMAPPQQQKQQLGPTMKRASADAMHSLSKGFARAGMTMIGSALGELEPQNPNGQPTAFSNAMTQQWAQTGEEFATVIQQRWDEREYENWKSGAFKEWQEKTSALDAQVKERTNALDMGMFITSDGEKVPVDPNSEQAEMMRKTIFRDNMSAMQAIDMPFLESGSKYQYNRMVGAHINQVMEQKAKTFQAYHNGGPNLEAGNTAADTDLKRAQAWALRNPQPKEGSGKDKDDPLRNLTAGEALRAIATGGKEFAHYIDGPNGKAFVAQAASAVRESIIRRNEALGLDENAEALQAEMAKHSNEIRDKAIGELVRHRYGDYAADTLMREDPNASRYFSIPQPPKKFMTHRLTPPHMKEFKEKVVSPLVLRAMTDQLQYEEYGSSEDELYRFIRNTNKKAMRVLEDKQIEETAANRDQVEAIELFVLQFIRQNVNSSPMVIEKFGKDVIKKTEQKLLSKPSTIRDEAKVRAMGIAGSGAAGIL